MTAPPRLALSGLAASVVGLALALTGVLKLVPWFMWSTGNETVAPSAVALPPWILVGSALVETGVGIGLTLRPRSDTWLRSAAALVAALFVTAVALIAAHIPLSRCGCFGPVSAELESFHLSVIGVLLVLLGVAFLTVSPRTGERAVAEETQRAP